MDTTFCSRFKANSVLEIGSKFEIQYLKFRSCDKKAATDMAAFRFFNINYFNINYFRFTKEPISNRSLGHRYSAVTIA